MESRIVNRRGATIGGFVAVLLWSTTIALARSLSESLGAIGAGAAACLFSGVLASVFSLRTREGRRELSALPKRYLLVCGALFVGYTLLLYLAVGFCRNREEVLIVGLLNYLWPALTLLLSLRLQGGRAGWTLWPATFLALTGIVLVLLPVEALSWSGLKSAMGANPLAYILAVVAAFCWAFYSNLARRWAAGTGSSAGVALFLMVSALLLSLAALFIPENRRLDLPILMETGALGTATFLGYTLWDRAMRNGNLTLVSSFSYLTPLLSTLVSVVYLQIRPGFELWLGCFLLVVGSFLSWRSLEA